MGPFIILLFYDAKFIPSCSPQVMLNKIICFKKDVFLNRLMYIRQY